MQRRHEKGREVKIFVTGGHITPALAVIEELKKLHPSWSPTLIGRRYALEGKKIDSEEWRLSKIHGIRFIELTAGRLTRVFGAWTLLSLMKIPLGFLQALFLIVMEKPTVVVSFGGYIALPVSIASWLARVPIVTHEQTRRPGLTNRIIAKFARYICVSFEDHASIFSHEKTVFTGLPIRAAIFKKTNPPQWAKSYPAPFIFFTGGSTGSTSLNDTIFSAIPELIETNFVVHQTGRLSIGQALNLQHGFPTYLRSRYLPFPYLDVPDYAWVLQNATIVVGRSGANTVGEVAAVGKIALWIPLPWSAGGEQQENARRLVTAGSSELLGQATLIPSLLIERITDILSHAPSFQTKARELAKTQRRDGAKRMVSVIERIVA